MQHTRGRTTLAAVIAAFTLMATAVNSADASYRKPVPGGAHAGAIGTLPNPGAVSTAQRIVITGTTKSGDSADKAACRDFAKEATLMANRGYRIIENTGDFDRGLKWADRADAIMEEGRKEWNCSFKHTVE
jgi:hypothetical protein